MVLEEIAMYEDDPQDQIHDLASRAVFPEQALGRPVIGTAEVIGSVPADGVRAYHAAPLHGAEHGGGGGRERPPRARDGAVRGAARRPVDASTAWAPSSPPARARPRSW